jgi:hypothetical protein
MKTNWSEYSRIINYIVYYIKNVPKNHKFLRLGSSLLFVA